MKKISQTVNGIMLKNTTPAAIERYITDHIYKELGEFHDLANVKVLLRVDKEDGDLSGNVENGFGNVAIVVGKSSIHVPFIIHEKILLPFDVIRKGDEEVSYDMSKLRKLVVALDRNHKEQSDGENGSEGIVGVVDRKDVPYQNGFLGTIMSVRDHHRNTDVNGVSPFTHEAFGDMDDARMSRTASANFDFADSFEEFHEKLASVHVFTDEDVKAVAEKIQKEAAILEETTLANVPTTIEDSRAAHEVSRSIANVKKDKLVDISRVASGNNVTFPVFHQDQFSYRVGRVYQTIKPLVDRAIKSDISRIALDNKGEYAFLKSTDKFMVSTKEAPKFEMDVTSVGALLIGKMYGFEFDNSSISVPFIIEMDFVSQHEDSMAIHYSHYNQFKHLNTKTSTLFRNAYEARQVLQSVVERGRFGNPVDVVTILALKGSKAKPEIMDWPTLKSFIARNEKDEDGVRASEHVANFRSHNSDASARYYVVGEDYGFFNFERRIEGHFTDPEGFFKEGPLFKEAAFEGTNKARLYINENPKPVTYTLEWSFTLPEEGGDEEESFVGYNMQKRRMENLAPAQARKLLQDLGFDARKQELFFQISQQNGRYAEFALPDAEIAANVAPEDKGQNKAKQAVSNIANATLHAGNFTRVMGDVVSDNLANGLGELFGKRAELSLEIAQEFEKIAEELRGASVLETAQLLNAKYHMDKLAHDITNGFVKEAEGVFGEIKQWEGAISKKASELIHFNREQMLYSDKPLISPYLVKEAIKQLDEFAEYVAVAPAMEKRAFFIQAHASK